jgi:low affinity Fe/Cu permease
VDTWNRLAHLVTHHAGSKHAFGLALVLIAAWAGAGISAGPTRAWELTVTCGVPILTLLMVIVLQHTQNRDSQALQIKLNELLLALEEPDDQIIHAGRLGDEELDDLDARQTEQAEPAMAPGQGR